MSSVWERFDKIGSTEGVAEAKNAFKPIDAGQYDAVLEGIEAGETKETNLPMMKVKFRTTTNKLVYVNQVMMNISDQTKNDWAIGKAVSLYEGIIGDEYDYQGLAKFKEDIEATPVGTEHIIKVVYDEKKDAEHKFPKVTVFPPATFVTPDEDVPF